MIKLTHFREYLIVAFIALGLAAFTFEKHLSPKILESTGSGEGNADTINLTIKAYKKSNGDIRVTDIKVEHNDTEEIANPAIAKLIDSIKSRQKFSKNEIEDVAGATYTSEGFKDALS